MARSQDVFARFGFAGARQWPTPALIVDRQGVAANLAAMLQVAGEPARLVPHVKTHKMPAVVRLQQQAGIDQFKCATLAEAQMLARCGVRWVLVAYPLVGPHLRRLMALARAFPKVRFGTLVDDAKVLQQLADEAAAAAVTIDVLLDLDVGQQRTGVPPGPAARQLYRQLATSPALCAAGLHAYDGHVKEQSLEARTAMVDACFRAVKRLRSELISAGYPVPRLIAGGTPTMTVHARHVDRLLSPGTCVFWDAGYGEKFPDLPFVPAAAVLTRVVSKPGPQRLCLDLGYKAVASNHPDPRVVFPELPAARQAIHNEEHLVIEAPGAESLTVGDVLVAVPYHICPTCALYPEAIVVDAGEVVDRWPIVARDRELTI